MSLRWHAPRGSYITSKRDRVGLGRSVRVGKIILVLVSVIIQNDFAIRYNYATLTDRSATHRKHRAAHTAQHGNEKINGLIPILSHPSATTNVHERRSPPGQSRHCRVDCHGDGVDWKRVLSRPSGPARSLMDSAIILRQSDCSVHHQCVQQ